MVEKGTRFRKADLHIHTPASKCYTANEKGVTAAEIIEEAANKGLEVIAVTDHNNIASLEDIIKEARKKGIVVFPGIELTAQEAHVLALFDPSYPINKLNDFLPAIGIDEDQRGEADAMAKSMEEVISAIEKRGGVAIAAHANNHNGLFKHPRGQYKIRICSKPELRALEFADQEDVQRFANGQVPKYPAKACVCGSDAHCLADIGQRYTYLKMDNISITGLRQALADWQVRVKFPWDSTETCCPRIKSLAVNQGFFEGVTFGFHPNLTCFVGGRGTGKSTTIEFLRYCFDDISTIKDIGEDTFSKVEKLIGAGGKVTVTYVNEEGEELLIEREVSDESFRDQVEQIMVDSNGEPTILFSTPIFFSQGEIARIATNPIAQLDLIDRYISLYDENKQERELIDKLNGNRNDLIEHMTEYDKLIGEIKDPYEGKLATQTEYNRLQKRLQSPIFTEFPKWEAEERFINKTLAGLSDLQEEITNTIDGIDIASYFPAALDTSHPNPKLLNPLTKISTKLQKHLQFLKTTSETEIGKAAQQAKDIQSEWQLAFTPKKSKYEKELEKLGADIVEAQKRFRALGKRLEELAGKEKDANVDLKTISSLNKDRQDLLRGLNETRFKRFQKRLAKAQEWERKLNSQIKIDLINCGDKTNYIGELKTLLKGAYVHESDMKLIANSIDPEKLVDASLNNDVEWLIEQSKARQEVMTRLVEQLRTRDREDVLDLQIVALPDLPRISFQLEPGKYKPLNELSIGTKSTVIVSLTMIEGNTPLIIDQPEDSLDTEFIYQEVVRKLRTEKDTRQFIFTSHNANVVVAGEAELTYVLSATSDRGTIKSSGGIDREETNQLMLLHLEGGPDAFKLRAQKYI